MTRQMFKRLFTPVALRGKTLRNRIVFGAHTANMAVDGLPTERHVGYYAERAMGGAGMIVVEPIPVHAAAVLTRGNFRHDDDAVIPHFRKVTDAIRGHGAVAIQQLYHVGQHGDADNSFHPGWSPSGMPSYHDSDGSHRMTEAEIEGDLKQVAEQMRPLIEASRAHCDAMRRAAEDLRVQLPLARDSYASSALSYRQRAAAGTPDSTASKSGPPITRCSTSSGRPGPTGATTAGAGASRTGPA